MLFTAVREQKAQPVMRMKHRQDLLNKDVAKLYRNYPLCSGHCTTCVVVTLWIQFINAHCLCLLTVINKLMHYAKHVSSQSWIYESVISLSLSLSLSLCNLYQGQVARQAFVP